MQIIKVSATHARNNFFELLNWVQSGKQVVVEKDKKEVAVISAKLQKTDLRGLDKAMKAIHGIGSDFDLSKSPLRGERSRKWLKKLRKSW